MRIFKKYWLLFYIAFLAVCLIVALNWQIITKPKIEVEQIWRTTPIFKKTLSIRQSSKEVIANNSQ